MKDVTMHKPVAETGQFMDLHNIQLPCLARPRGAESGSTAAAGLKISPHCLNSRATLRVSGESIRRPNGRRQKPDGSVSRCRPSS